MLVVSPVSAVLSVPVTTTAEIVCVTVTPILSVISCDVIPNVHSLISQTTAFPQSFSLFNADAATIEASDFLNCSVVGVHTLLT